MINCFSCSCSIGRGPENVKDEEVFEDRVAWGMVVGVTAGRWRTITVRRYRHESLRTHPTSWPRSWPRSWSQPWSWYRVRYVPGRGNVLPEIKSVTWGGMRDHPRHRDHLGQAMPLEEAQGLLPPSSRTGNQYFKCRFQLPTFTDIFMLRRFYSMVKGFVLVLNLVLFCAFLILKL